MARNNVVVAHASGHRTFKELLLSDLSRKGEIAQDFGAADAQLLQVLVDGEAMCDAAGHCSSD